MEKIVINTRNNENDMITQEFKGFAIGNIIGL